jgi:sugar-specific transcriptional regulator TrmB
MEIKPVLKEFNLSDNEIEVYLACLKIGQSSVIRISELTGIPKSTCYDILNNLISRGLISQVVKDNIKYFEATNPEFLIDDIIEKKKKLKEILPKINSLRKTVVNKPRAELYIGKEAIKAIYKEVEKTGKEFLVLGNFSLFHGFFDWFSDNFIKKRVAAKIKCRMIAEDSPITREVIKQDKKEMRISRINNMMADQKAECYIFGDKVAFLSFSKGEPIGTIIENKEIADLQRTIFEDIWKHSK